LNRRKIASKRVAIFQGGRLDRRFLYLSIPLAGYRRVFLAKNIAKKMFSKSLYTGMEPLIKLSFIKKSEQAQDF